MASALERLIAISKFRKEAVNIFPEVMAGYEQIKDAVYKDGALSAKMKRLIGIAVAIRAGCEPCSLGFTKYAADLGATRAEIIEAATVAISLGGSTGFAGIRNVVELLDELGIK